MVKWLIGRGIMRVYVVVTLQGEVPFPIGVDLFRSYEDAKKCKEEIERQYEGNRAYILVGKIVGFEVSDNARI